MSPMTQRNFSRRNTSWARRACLPDRVRCPAAACRLPTAGPYHPGTAFPTRNVRLTRHQQGFTVVRPSSLPLTGNPRTEQGPLGFPLGFAPHRPDPRRTPGRGQVPTLTRTTPSTSSHRTSFSAVTHRVRLHVAGARSCRPPSSRPVRPGCPHVGVRRPARPARRRSPRPPPRHRLQ